MYMRDPHGYSPNTIPMLRTHTLSFNTIIRQEKQMSLTSGDLIRGELFEWNSTSMKNYISRERFDLIQTMN